MATLKKPPRRPLSTTWGVRVLALCLAACASPSPSDEGPVSLSPTGSEAEGAPEALAPVLEALAAKDFALARAALVPLLVDKARAEASAALLAGDPRTCLTLLDEPLSLRPHDADLWFLRGQAALVAARNDSQPQFYYEDAAGAFETAFREGRRVLAGSVSAREYTCLVRLAEARFMLLDAEGALAVARNADRALADLIDEAPALDPPLEWIWAKSAFARYIEQRQAGQDSQALFLEAEEQLSRLVTFEAWRRFAFDELANLYQWQGDLAGARTVVEQALAFEPEDNALHDRLVALLLGEGGQELVLTRYEQWMAAFGASPAGAWRLALARFEKALRSFETGRGEASLFEQAEADFLRARQLDSAREATARTYEACARAGMGYLRLNAGDLEAAERLFRSMEDSLAGGMTLAVGARLPDGWTGIEYLLGQYAERGADPAAPEVDRLRALREAARLAEELAARRPQSANDRNNAGFFLRDAAVLAEALGRREEALQLIERSWQNYARAAELAPEDIRVVNDAGLVMTYYLRTDPGAAEELLLRAEALGRERLGDLRAEDREAAQWEDPIEAWGDACQNLGILHLTLKNDPAGAVPWLERAKEIGPPRRSALVDELLAWIAAQQDGQEVDPATFATIIWPHQPPAR